MHGRLKVRTSEEEKERKKKENVLKVKAYRAAMTKILAKRQKSELDDEMLQLSAQILLRNPDVSTLWNVRRECLLHISKILEDNTEEKQKLFDSELSLTEHCLTNNPKSYGAWHHRCWSLEHSPLPNWNREVELCNKYLKLDERNFHTWDYRRYVVTKAGVEKQQELDFCTDKIKVNFSNYSSWHYRSQLLPALFPYEGEAVPKRAMNEVKLKEELEMVLTAAFTDPDDSSAWFYQRWLLGYSRPELDVCAFRCDKEKAVLSFTKPTDAKELKVSLVAGNSELEQRIELKGWSTLNDNEVDTIWIVKVSCESILNDINKIEINIPGSLAKILPLKPYNDNFYYFQPPNRTIAFSTDVLAELQTQLESCNELLEIEPDSKWTLLTTALLMRAIDRELHHSKSLEHMEKLQKVDYLRAGYYKDLSSKWILEKELTDWSKSDFIPEKLSLLNTQLSSICYAQYLVIADELDVLQELKDLTAPIRSFHLLKA